MNLFYPILALAALLSISTIGFAQSYKDMIYSGETDFNKIQAAAEEYFDGRDKGRGSGYKQYKRWERYWISRLDENERITNVAARNLAAYNRVISSPGQRTTHGYWEDMGPHDYTVAPQGAAGLGRVNCIAFHPTDPNTFYIGTPNGGMWKTTDDGSSWSCITNGLPSIGISSILINPLNPDLMYILTGDGDGNNSTSVGVLKSLNGGETWQTTALSFSTSTSIRGYKMLMHPDLPNTIFVATNNGIYKTTNGFLTVEQPIITGTFTDIEFKPGTPSTIYAARSPVGSPGGFYRSTSNGDAATWFRFNEEILDTLNSSHFDRIAIGVTPANPNAVYLLYAKDGSPTDPDAHGFKGIYRSLTSGDTFLEQSNSPNIMGWASDGSGSGSQANYDIALTIDPNNQQVVYVGGINIWKSVNGATAWDIVAHWVGHMNPIGYTHADIHAIEFHNGDIYVGSDGGIYKSTDGGSTWINLSEGLGITQFYYIDVVNDVMVGGSQDNGSCVWSTSSSTAQMSMGGDGFACVIDYSNTDVLYLSHQDARLRSENSGWNFTPINQIYPPAEMEGFWDADLLLHPTDPNKLINSQLGIYLSDDMGATWTEADSILTGNLLIDMAQGTNDPNRLYTTDRVSVRTTANLYNATPDFDNISAGLPIGGAVRVEQITVDPDNANRVWVGLTGYNQTHKVYYSMNAGEDWQNVTGNIPNVPVQSIIYQPGSNDGVYVGTDIGVFYTNADISNWNVNSSVNWLYFSNGLPATTVDDMDFDGGYLYAGTYGRGVWRTAVYTSCPVSLSLTPANNPGGTQTYGLQRYTASDYIISTRELTAGIGTDVGYSAGSYIRLDPGFEVRTYGEFEAKIGGCPD